jgi:hypothetical protein
MSSTKWQAADVLAPNRPDQFGAIMATLIE